MQVCHANIIIHYTDTIGSNITCTTEFWCCCQAVVKVLFLNIQRPGRVRSLGQKPPGRIGSRVKNPDPVPSLSRAFLVVGPRILNDLPKHTTSAESLSAFCQRLKTRLFEKSISWSITNRLAVDWLIYLFIYLFIYSFIQFIQQHKLSTKW